MRVTLDLAAGLIVNSPADATPVDPLIIALGEAPPTLRLVGRTLNPPARVEFAAVQALGSATIVSGALDIADADALEDLPAQVMTLEDEDWAPLGLVALFDPVTLDSVDLIGQYRWRDDDNAPWRYLRPVTVRVLNTALPSTLIPGAVSVGSYLYLTSVTRYTGGASTDLDDIATANGALPLGVIVRFVTTNGESAWRLESGTTAENVAAGIVRPDDYGTSNHRIWVRQSGL